MMASIGRMPSIPGLRPLEETPEMKAALRSYIIRQRQRQKEGTVTLLEVCSAADAYVREIVSMSGIWVDHSGLM